MRYLLMRYIWNTECIEIERWNIYNYYSSGYTLATYNFTSPKDTAMMFQVYATTHGRISQKEKQNFQMKACKAVLRILWNLLLTELNCSQFRWKETGGAGVMCSPKWGFHRCNVLGRWFSDFVCSCQMLKYSNVWHYARSISQTFWPFWTHFLKNMM